ARPHRHLQPQLLRGDAGRARPPGVPRRREAAVRGRDEAHLGRAVRGHPPFRALPRAQRHRDPEVLPPRLERRAEAAVPRAPRESREELEVLRNDAKERAFWDDYMRAYEDTIRHTASD